MSQYPQPYPQTPAPYPPYGGGPYAGPYAGLPDPLSAGRRAAILMFVTGGLLLLLGACNAVQSVVVSSAQLESQVQQQQQMMGQAGGGMNLSATALRTMSVAFGLLMLAAGGTLVGLAVGVRRGGRRSTVAGLTVTVLLGGVIALLLLMALIAGTQTAVGLVLACVIVFPAAAAALQTVWLVGAVRNLSRLTAGRDQLAAQYWQYHQQMQAYAGTAGYPPGYPAYGQGGGYGYSTSPTPGPVIPPTDPA